MIHSVYIKNWKGHDELSINFGEGISFLIGPNGSGKTSILDAICFALLGDIGATPVYQRIDFKDLIRDSSHDMEIELAFSVPEGGEFVVGRAKPVDGNRRAFLKSGDVVIARSWDKVTSEILTQLNTSDLFLKSVILLSEGDTFAYSTKPPKEGLTKHIEKVLGINRMENLRENLSGLKRSYVARASEISKRIEEVRSSTKEDERKSKALGAQVSKLEIKRDDLSQKVDRLSEQAGIVASRNKSLQNLIERVKALNEEWKLDFGKLPSDHDYLPAIETLKMSIEQERADLLSQRDSLRDEIAFLTAQRESQENILKVVIHLEEDQKEVPCPICKRPLTASMITAIKTECEMTSSQLNIQAEERKGQLPSIEKNLNAIEERTSKLMKIEATVRNLLEIEPKTLSTSNLEKHLSEAIDEQESLETEIAAHRENLNQINNSSRKIKSEMIVLSARVDEKRRHESVQSLACERKGEFLTELFLHSIASTVDEQRRIQLGPLTEELSVIWSAFMGMDVEVSLDKDAQITVTNAQTKSRLVFPQLSGGEKTALLIFTQILLCKHFSDANFMMLDEPLEHLDARNRWSLVRFLVDTTKRGFPKQLIVTTVEETLLREYFDDTQVTVNLISGDRHLIHR